MNASAVCEGLERGCVRDRSRRCGHAGACDRVMERTDRTVLGGRLPHRERAPASGSRARAGPPRSHARDSRGARGRSSRPPRRTRRRRTAAPPRCPDGSAPRARASARERDHRLRDVDSRHDRTPCHRGRGDEAGAGSHVEQRGARRRADGVEQRLDRDAREHFERVGVARRALLPHRALVLVERVVRHRPSWPAVHASSCSTGHEFTTDSTTTPHSAARSVPNGCQSSCSVACESVSIEIFRPISTA